MSEEDKFLKALKKLREEESKKSKKRSFDQTIDLIVNLKEFDVRKHSFNIFVDIPNKFKEKKIAGFFEKDSKIIDSIKRDNFVKYKDKKDIKKLANSYDNFVANAKLMPAIATSFGRILGPIGKMPSPRLGIIGNEDVESIKKVIERINSTTRVMVKEPSIKVGIAKESLEDKKIIENILSCYKKILDNLPKNKDNVKNVKIKFTMGKPVSVEL